MASIYDLPGVKPPKPNALSNAIPSIRTSQNTSSSSSSNSSSSRSSSGGSSRSSSSSSSSPAPSAYNLPGVTPPVENPVTAVIPQVITTPRNMSTPSTSTSNSSNTQAYNTGGMVMPVTTPGGALMTEAQPPGVAYNIGQFVNRVVNPQSSSLTLGEAWSNIFKPLGYAAAPKAPGAAAVSYYFKESSNLYGTKTGGMSDTKINSQILGTNFIPTQSYVGWGDTVQTKPIGTIDILNNLGSEAIKSTRAVVPVLAQVAVESAIISGATTGVSLVQSSRVTALESERFIATGYKTAFSSREVEQGFTSGYKLIGARQTESASQVVVMDLKTISTGEGKIGFGLSRGKSTVEVDNLFFPGSKKVVSEFSLSGGSESLGFQPKLSSFVSTESGIGKAFGARSQGTIFQEGLKPNYFTSVGASKKVGEGVFDFISTKGSVGLRAYPKEAALTGINFDAGTATFMQPMYYRGKVGTVGRIFDVESKGVMSGSGFTELGNLGKGGRTAFKVDTQGNMASMQVLGSTKADANIFASASGVFENVQVQAPKYSTGAWAGLGMYERTSTMAGLDMGSSFKSPSMTQTNIFTPSLSSFSTQATKTGLFTPSVLDTTTITDRTNVFGGYGDTGLKQFDNTNIAFSFNTNFRQDQIQPPATAYRFDTPAPTTLTPGFGFPGGGGGFDFSPIILPSIDFNQGSLTPRASGKQRKKRTPSLYAAMFGITSSKASAAELTGLIGRPILTRRKR